MATASSSPPSTAAFGAAAVERDEQERVDAYCREHRVDALVGGLVGSLLRDRPATRPREHFAHLLRVQLLKQKHGEEQATREASMEASEVPGRLLTRLFRATKSITSEIVPKETINAIIRETLALLECDRVSFFVYDRRIDMLVLNASNLEHPIRVKPGQGIAGHVFQTQETVNIPRCYEDARFDQTFDRQTGYRTSSLLTMPVVDFEGECRGVLQAINKQGSAAASFTRIDEILMENLAQHVSIAMRNAEVYRAAIVTNERANALIQMMQALSQDLGMQSMVLTITMHANELVQADRCYVFVVDRQDLWSVSADSGVEIRVPKSGCVGGECASTGKLIAIPDAHQDPRFNPETDEETGYRTQSILAVPVLSTGNHGGPPQRTLAVIEMINKTEFDGAVGRFDEEDIQVMETFATFVASKLGSSPLLLHHHLGSPEANDEASHAFSPVPPATKRSDRKTSKEREHLSGVGMIAEEPGEPDSP